MSYKFPDHNDAVRAAIKKSGGTVRWARHFGIARSTVFDWGNNGAVPPKHAVIMERDSFHLVTRQELRPSDYWLWWPDLPKPSNQTDTPQPAPAPAPAPARTNENHCCSADLRIAIETLIAVYQHNIKNAKHAGVEDASDMGQGADPPSV